MAGVSFGSSPENGDRPAAQGATVRARHVEQVADHLDRDLRGEVVDEIDLALLRHLLEQRVDEARHVRFHARDRLLVDCAHDNAAHARVQRRVVEHQARGVVLVQR